MLTAVTLLLYFASILRSTFQPNMDPSSIKNSRKKRRRCSYHNPKLEISKLAKHIFLYTSLFLLLFIVFGLSLFFSPHTVNPVYSCKNQCSLLGPFWLNSQINTLPCDTSFTCRSLLCILLRSLPPLCHARHSWHKNRQVHIKLM